MSTYIENFKRFRPLLNELVSRDIKIKYRRSIMGVLWTLLNPLLMMIVLSIVFSNLFKFDIENFPLYLLSGQVIFNFYSDSTNNAMGAIIFNAPLIKKVYVPKYLFVVSRVVSSFINLMAAFTALLFVMVATRAELHWTALLSFIPLGRRTHWKYARSQCCHTFRSVLPAYGRGPRNIFGRRGYWDRNCACCRIFFSCR